MNTLCGGSNWVDNTLEADKISKIKVFPNPASDIVTVSNPIGAQIEILDLQGRVVRSVLVNSDHQTIQISDIPPCAYIVKMQEKTLTVSYKEIKQYLSFE